METNPGKNNQATGDKDRLSALEDYSLLDIATGPEYSSEDSLDAQATIKERQENGVFDEDAEQNISTEDDLLQHNYGVMNGKIMAPPEGYRNEGEIQQSIGSAALDEYFEDYDDSPTWMSTPKPAKFRSREEEPANHNQKHKDEMHEAERGKFNERRVKEETEQFREFKKYAPEHWKYRGKRFEGNNYYIPTKREKLIDREAQKEGEERREYLLQLNGERVSSQERIDSAIEYAKWKLSKKSAVKQMYAEGALDGISDGDFSLNPNFIYEGLKSLHGKEIERRAGFSREMVWDSIRYDGMLPRIESPDQLIDLERNALESAIELGVIETKEGVLGEQSFKTALPISKLGPDGITKILENYGIREYPEDDLDGEQSEEAKQRNNELYEKFESGFVNIVDALKGDTKSEEGFLELNWYFENLLQGKDEDEIADRVINIYEAGENTSFVEKFDQFMKWRQRMEKNVDKKTKYGDEIDEIDQAILSSTLDVVDINGIPEEIVFPDVDLGVDRSPRGGKAWQHPINYGRRKYDAFTSRLEEIETIPGFKESDPYMALSKPFYLRKYYRKERASDGTMQKVLYKVDSIPAHFDPDQKAYISDKTGNQIQAKSIRQYLSANFSINGVNVTIKEGITDMSSALYVVIGNDLQLGFNSPLFQGTMKEAIEKVKQANGTIFKKSHCSSVKDGVKGYHGFENMWNETIKRVLKEIDKLTKSTQVA